MRRFPAFCGLVTLSTTGFLACTTVDFPPPGAGPTESWLVAIYMAADNNLDPAASSDLRELARSGPPDNVEVLVFIDRTEPGRYSVGDVPGLPSFSDARVYRLAGGGFELVEELGEVNSTDPAVVHDFIARAAAVQADRRALIFWDHGSVGSYGTDETDGTRALPIPALRSAFRIDPANQQSDSYRFDIVGFDTCLLSSIDAFVPIAEVTDIFIGSAELEPGDGWDYDGLMRAMRDADLSPESFATGIVESFTEYYGSRPQRTGGIEVTLAAWRTDTASVTAARESLEALIDLAAENAPAALYAGLRQAVAQSYPYYDRTIGTVRSSYVDLGDLAGEIAENIADPDVAAAAMQYLDQIRSVQIAYSSTDTLPGTVGISYPVVADSSDPNRGEETLRIESIDAILAEAEGSIVTDLIAQDAEAPRMGLAIRSTEAGTDFDRLDTFWFATDDVAIDTLRVLLGVRDDDGSIIIANGINEAAAQGVASVNGQTRIPLSGIALTDAEPAERADYGLAVQLRGQWFMPVALADEAKTAEGLLIFGSSLDIQGLAVKSDDEVWSVLVWDEVRDQPFTVAPRRFALDPVTNTFTQTTGKARTAADLRIELLPLDGLDVVLVGLVEDLADQSFSVVLDVPE